MPTHGTFDTNGFRVVADSALGLIVGTEAAGAGHVAANVRDMAQKLGTNLDGINQQVQTLQASNVQGFEEVTSTLGGDLTGLQWLGGASILVQAVGFAAVATELSGVRGEIGGLREDMREQGQQLLDAQRASTRHLEAIEDIARSQLETSQQILETLASSRRVEATQLIEQGWANLLNGYREEAQQRFEQSLEFDNTVFLPHAELGDIYEQVGDLERAEAHLRKAADFSRDMPGETSGFSLLRLVRFLAEQDRRPEAVKLLQEGVESGRLISWRLGAAELASHLGLVDFALAEVRAAIAEDDKAFLAAMASVALASIGARLTALLIEIDRKRREPILDLLRDHTRKIDLLTAFAEYGHPSNEIVSEIRRSSASVLERGLIDAYPTLGDVASRAAQLSSEMDDLAKQGCEAIRLRCDRWLDC